MKIAEYLFSNLCGKKVKLSTKNVKQANKQILFAVCKNSFTMSPPQNVHLFVF